MEFKTFSIAAGETKTFFIGGNYVEVIDSVDPINVLLYGPTGSNEFAESIIAGTYLKEPFTSFNVTSATAQTITLLITGREGGSRRIAGAVELTNTAGTYTNGPVAVTNAVGGITALAANAARRYCLIQNTDPIANMWVTMDGSAPTTTRGVKLTPGGAWECPAMFAPVGAIKVIADQAAATAQVVEG